MNQPFKCPVCNGNGLVPNGFYTQTGGQWASTSTTPEACKSCHGTGVVWGKDKGMFVINLDTRHQDNDIKAIARELYEGMKQRSRAIGVVE